MPFFSIVIPTYNRAYLIGRTIESVLTQQCDDLELIIVDDGSTDDTRKVIERYNDPRLRYIYQENGERGKARNTGVKVAKGKYIFFLDSDDMLFPEHLEHAKLEIKERDNPEFFHIRYCEMDKDGKKSYLPNLNTKTIKEKSLKRNQFACQFFLRKDIAIAFPFSESRDLYIGEDWGVVLRIAVRYPLHFSNEILAAIIQHEKRSMQVAEAEFILKSKDVLLEELAKDEKITPHILKNVNVELTWLAALSASIANRKNMAFYLWSSAFGKRPSILFERRSMAIFKKILLGGSA